MLFLPLFPVRFTDGPVRLSFRDSRSFLGQSVSLPVVLDSTQEAPSVAGVSCLCGGRDTLRFVSLSGIRDSGVFSLSIATLKERRPVFVSLQSSRPEIVQSLHSISTVGTDSKN